MENMPKKDEIVNSAHLQVEQSQHEKKPLSQDQLNERNDDAGYTPQENQFADGKGTQLNEKLAPYRGDIEDELSEEVERADEEKFEEEQLDEDFENFKDKQTQ